MEPTSPRFSRPLWAGYYYAAGRYGDFLPQSNCQVLSLAHFADSEGVLPPGAWDRFRSALEWQPTFISPEDIAAVAVRGLWSRVAGIVLDEHPDSKAMEADALRTRLLFDGFGVPERPIVATLTRDQPFRQDWRRPAGVDVLAVEVYLDPPGFDNFETARLAARGLSRDLIGALPGMPRILIGQAYDRNGLWIHPETLPALILGTAEAAEDSPAVCGLWWFAYARPGGARTYPILEAWTNAIAAQARQPLIGRCEVARMELTIGEYRPTSGPVPLRVRAVADLVSGAFELLEWRYRFAGASGWTVAAVNPAGDLDHTFEFTTAGDYEISLLGRGPAGTAETTRQRIVHARNGEPEKPELPTYPAFVEVEGPQIDQRYRETLGPDRPTSGDIRHTAWRRLVEGWSHERILADIGPAPIPPPDPEPGPPPPAEDVPGANGRARPIGRAVGDDSGPKLYPGVSRFNLVRLWKFERDRALRMLDRDRATGYRYARVFAQVENIGADTYWSGYEVDPIWPDHEALVANLTRAAFERGLLIGWTIIGKGGRMENRSARQAFVQRTAAVLRDVLDGVLFAEVMNEPGAAGGVSLAELLDLWDIAKTTAPDVLLGTGAVWTERGWCPPPREDYEGATAMSPEGWQKTQQGIGFAHLDRDTQRGELQDRPWRQAWDVGLEGLPWVEGEGIGPGSSVNSENRAAVLRSHRAVAFLCRAFASCLHGAPGVRGVGDWENESGYLEAPKGIRFLPGNLANGRQINANPKFPDRPWTLPDDSCRSVSGRGIVRAYTCEVDGVYYTIPFGPISPWQLIAEKALRVECFRQQANDRIWAREFAPGEILSDDGGEPDYILRAEPL